MSFNKHEKVTSTDILIIGNGALGLFIADELSRRECGKKIAVVGPKERDGGASKAAGAMLPTFSEVSTDTFRTEEGRIRFQIGLEAHKLWDSTINRLQNSAPKAPPLKVSEDTYVVLNSKGSELDSENFDAMLDALEDYQEPWTDVDPTKITGYNPQPDCRAFRAVHLPNEGGIDARGVLAALEHTLEEADVPLINQFVRKIRNEGGVVTGVELNDGSIIDAQIVVIAAGARSEELIQSASKDLDTLPIFPGLGLGMVAKRSSGEGFRSIVRTPNRAFGCGLHIVPAGDGREYIGATNSASPKNNSGVRWQDLHYISKYAMQQLDTDIAFHQVEQFLRGFRPITLDGFPLIGWLPISGLYLMTGTFRDGVHGAPLLSKHVANEILGQPGLIEPIFQPTRKPIFNRSIEESIIESTHHSVANWYEYGENSAFMPQKEITEHYKGKVTRIYDELNSEYALPPEVLWYSVGDPDERIKKYLHNL